MRARERAVLAAAAALLCTLACATPERSPVRVEPRSRPGSKSSAPSDAHAQEAVLARQAYELRARETDRGLVLTLGDAFFDIDRAGLKPAAHPPLARLAAFLRDHPDRHVRVEGHSDDPRSADSDRKLAAARAEAVREALVAQGVEPSRVTAQGPGPSPLASGAAPEQPPSRRVEIVVPPEPTQSGSAPPAP